MLPVPVTRRLSEAGEPKKQLKNLLTKDLPVSIIRKYGLKRDMKQEVDTDVYLP